MKQFKLEILNIGYNYVISLRYDLSILHFLSAQ